MDHPASSDTVVKSGWEVSMWGRWVDTIRSGQHDGHEEARDVVYIRDEMEG